jgi:hypothetical protein
MAYSYLSRHYTVLKKLFPVPFLGGDQDASMDIEGLALDRAEDLSKKLFAEINPDSVTDDPLIGTISQWEIVFGIPVDDSKPIADRRKAIVAKMLMPSGLNKEYFYAVAAALGYHIWPDSTYPYIDIEKGLFRPFRVGYSHVGIDKLYDQTVGFSKFVWVVFGSNVESDLLLQEIFIAQQPGPGEVLFQNT